MNVRTGTPRLIAFTWIAALVMLGSGCGLGGLTVSVTDSPGVVSVGQPVTLTVRVSNAAGCDLGGLSGSPIVGFLVIPFVPENTPNLDLVCSGVLPAELSAQAQSQATSLTQQLGTLSQSIVQAPLGSLYCMPYSTPFPDSMVCELLLSAPIPDGATVQGTMVVTPPTGGSFRSVVWAGAQAIDKSGCIDIVKNEADGIAAGVGCAPLTVISGAAPAASTTGLAALVALLTGVGLLAVRRLARGT